MLKFKKNKKRSKKINLSRFLLEYSRSPVIHLIYGASIIFSVLYMFFYTKGLSVTFTPLFNFQSGFSLFIILPVTTIFSALTFASAICSPGFIARGFFLDLRRASGTGFKGQAKTAKRMALLFFVPLFLTQSIFLIALSFFPQIAKFALPLYFLLPVLPIFLVFFFLKKLGLQKKIFKFSFLFYACWILTLTLIYLLISVSYFPTPSPSKILTSIKIFEIAILILIVNLFISCPRSDVTKPMYTLVCILMFFCTLFFLNKFF